MTIAPFLPPSPHDSAPSVRLGSWKEIAAYLGKVERTVKRWEAKRALPIHRPPGGRGSVYAYTWELDQWLKSRGEGDPEAAANPKLAAGAEMISDAEKPRESESAVTTGQHPELVTSAPASRLFNWSWHIPVLVLLPALVILLADFLSHWRSTSVHDSKVAEHRTIPPSTEKERQLAHELYLQGRFEWNKRTADSLNRALDLFTQAIVHDPFSAQIYAGLAETYLLLPEYSLMPGNEAYRRALAASKKAIELDDTLAEAHRSLAFAEVWGNWDFEAGQREFQRAIDLDPRDPLAHLWYANAFKAPGWFPMTLREINRAQELDPTSAVILADKGTMLFETGKQEEGLEMVKQVERTDSGFLAPHRFLANMYWNLRAYPDFLAESEKMTEIDQDPLLKETTAAARAGFERDGERGLLHDLYVAQKKLYAEGKLAGYFAAGTCVRLGRKEEALQLLRDDYDRHRAEFLYARTDLDLLTLKDEPGYQELMGKLRFPGSLPAVEHDAAIEASLANTPAAGGQR